MADMKSFQQRLLPILLFSVLGLLLNGCAEGPTKADPAVVKSLRKALVMEVEPEGAITPLDWRDEQEEAKASDEGPTAPPEDPADNHITLVGKVGGMPNPWPDQYPEFPWVMNESTFFLVDPATVAEFEAHAGDSVEDLEAHAADCPFCAREAANQSKAVAAISFVDEKGETRKIDIRELFGLAKGDVVVVKGVPTLLGEDLLVLQADGIFTRK